MRTLRVSIVRARGLRTLFLCHTKPRGGVVYAWEIDLTAVRWVIVDSDAAAVVTALRPDAGVGPACFWRRPAGTKVLGLKVGVAVAVAAAAAVEQSYDTVLPALSQPVAIVGGGGVRESEKGGCRRALRPRGYRHGAAPVRQRVVNRWNGRYCGKKKVMHAWLPCWPENAEPRLVCVSGKGSGWAQRACRTKSNSTLKIRSQKTGSLLRDITYLEAQFRSSCWHTGP